MKSVRMFFFAAMVLFLCACPATAYIEFKDGLIHNINYRIDENVLVDYQAPDMYTTVNWLDGAELSGWLRGYEQSRINIYGGSIYSLLRYDSGQVNISDGSINYLDSYDSSQVTISGGSISHLHSEHSSHVNISGGSIGNLASSDSSLVNISGGEIGDWLSSYSSSQVNISGGLINRLYSYGSSQVNISSGSIGYLQLSVQSKIKIFGSDSAVDGQPFGFGELTSIFGGSCLDEPWRHLTGTFLSGEMIDNNFRIGQDARIVLVPEPASAAIMAIGGFFLALRRRRC